MDTTTIEITKRQKAQLDDLKLTPSESYKDAVDRLLDGHDDEPDALTEARVRELVREELRERVVAEALA